MDFYTVLLKYLLIVSQIFVIVFCTNAKERFYLRPEFVGKGCASNDIAFTKIVPSKTACTGTCSQSSTCKCVSYNSVDSTCIGCTGIYNASSNFLDRPGHIFYESEIHKDDCASSICQNGATCVDALFSYTCTCTGGWTGSHCETDVDECVSNPCQNGGTCLNGQNEYTYVDECVSNPCQNGGTCLNGQNEYTCNCVNGWTGTNCDIDIDECSSYPCQNGATCINGPIEYACICAPGWAGPECNADVDECSSSPCANGGTCLNGLDEYTCTCTNGWTGENCDQGLGQASSGSHVGTQFITGFMSFGLSNDGTPHLLIVSSVETSTNVWVTIPYLSINEQHHVVNGFLDIEYPTNLLPAMSSQASLQGVEVTSDQPVTLYTMNYKTGLVDGTLELPTSALGQLYIVDAHGETANGLAQIVVISTTDNTAVTLNFPSGTTANIILNKYDVYQYRQTAVSGPLAGTTVNADNAVAVRVGHNCANVPNVNTVYCEFMVTSVPPVETLGSVFVVPYQRSRTDYSIGISAPHANTQFTIWDINGNMLTTGQMNPQESTFMSYYSSSIICITSTQDILVIQYGHGSANTFGDPSAMIVPAVKQFTSRYDFVVPDVLSNPGVISVVIDVSYDTSELMLNGSPATIQESHTVNIPGEGSSVNVVYIEINSGIKFTLNHLNPSAKFGAMLYARTSNSEYTTVLGYNL